MRTFFYIVPCVLCMGAALRGEGIWLGALLVCLYALRTHADSTVFSSVAVLIGIFLGLAGRESVWWSGALWWLPIFLAFQTEKLFEVESEFLRRVAGACISWMLWIALGGVAVWAGGYHFPTNLLSIGFGFAASLAVWLFVPSRDARTNLRMFRS